MKRVLARVAVAGVCRKAVFVLGAVEMRRRRTSRRRRRALAGAGDFCVRCYNRIAAERERRPNAISRHLEPTRAESRQISARPNFRSSSANSIYHSSKST